MDLIKRDYEIELFDTYRKLLTEKQQAYFEQYYYEDLSLAEIADNYEVSRNAVFDQLKKTTVLLEEYENKLHLVAKKEALQKLSQKCSEEIKNAMNKIIEE